MAINADQIRKVSAQFDESASTAGALILNSSLAGDGIAFTSTEGALQVQASDLTGTGLAESGNNLLIDVNATVDFSTGTPVYTFANDTTAEGLFVTGTPVDGNHAVNKTYVDGLVTGTTWKDPVCTIGLVGNAAETTIEGLSPSAGDAYVVSSLDGDSTISGTAAAVGDIFEYDGTSWQKILANSGGFPPADTRVVLSTSVALISPYTDATDDGKIATFSGSSLTATTGSEAEDGAAVLVNCETAYYENTGWIFDGTVPTGNWVQFAGGSAPTAGNGLSYSGSTLNVGAGAGISTSSTAVALDMDSGVTRTADGSLANANNPLYLDVTNGLNVKVDDSTISLDSGNSYRLYIPSGGVAGQQIAADSVAVGKLDFEWEVVDISAASFTFTSDSGFSLTNAALSDAAINDQVVLLRNGVDDMSRVGSLSSSGTDNGEYTLSGTNLVISGDITSSGDSYRLRYLIAH